MASGSSTRPGKPRNKISKSPPDSFQPYTRFDYCSDWFRDHYGTHGRIGPYVDSGHSRELSAQCNVTSFSRVRGITSEAPTPPARLHADSSPEDYARDCRKIYADFMRLFQDGVAYLIRDEYDPYSRLKVTRAYFSRRNPPSSSEADNRRRD